MNCLYFYCPFKSELCDPRDCSHFKEYSSLDEVIYDSDKFVLIKPSRLPKSLNTQNYSCSKEEK